MRGQTIAPLHRAPWTADEVPADAPPHQRWLAGDFLAAPMGPGPDGLHGLTANGDWRVTPPRPGTLRAVLDGAVQGATVVKELSVQRRPPLRLPAPPFHRRHRARCRSSNHAMISVPNGAKLSFSRKRWWETLAEPMETTQRPVLPRLSQAVRGCRRVSRRGWRDGEPAPLPLG